MEENRTWNPVGKMGCEGVGGGGGGAQWLCCNLGELDYLIFDIQ